MKKMNEPVKVGVIGVGYLGRFHAEKYAALAETELVGVADLNRYQAHKVGQALHTRDFVDYRGTPAAGFGGERGGPNLPAFCRGPGLPGRRLPGAGGKTRYYHPRPRPMNWCTCPGTRPHPHGGHLERFNSAMEELKPCDPARFIESHRLSFFKERGTDVTWSWI